MHEVVLCADEETVRDPSLIGLEGESLDSQRWLHAISDAEEARGYLRSGGPADEVWVASSDEVDPINLAAALKRDCAERRVCLVAWQGSGSLMSRAAAAGIDQVLGYGEMAQRYAQLKHQHAASPRRRTPERAAASRGAAGEAGRAGSLRGEAPHGPDAPRFQLHETQPMPPVARERRGRPPEGPLEPAAPIAGAAGRRGYVLTVVSASGGTGKSTVAALSALISARHGYRTVLVDADLQFGDAVLMLGDAGSLPIDRVVADPRCLDKAMPPAGMPAVVSAPGRMEQSELFSPQLPGVIDRAREAYDVVIVNTGSFWADSHIQLMELSSNTLFLMDQRPTSVKAARRALELCSRCGVASHPFLFAVNRCSRNPLLSSIDISCALNGVPVAEFKDGGRAVAELTGSGMAGQLVEERNDLCISLNDFLGQVIPAAVGDRPPAPAPDGRKAKSRRAPFRRRRKAACL